MTPGDEVVVVEGRRWTLLESTVGEQDLRVALSPFAHGAALDARTVAELSGAWPVGALVLVEGVWALRYTFAAGARMAEVERVLQFLGREARGIPRRYRFGAADSTYAHFAD